MSLLFTGGDADRVDCGSAANIDDLSAVTAWAWVYPTALAGNRAIIGKYRGGTQQGWEFVNTDASGNFNFIWERATTDLNYVTNSNPLTTNTWHFVAATADSSGANIFRGDLSTILTECGYGTAQVGSGAFNSDASRLLMVGNRDAPTPNASFAGRIAIAGLIARKLTLAELRSLQFWPRNVADQRLLMYLGFNGVGTQADYSGNKNNGTVTSAVQGVHVPLGPPFGFDVGLPYVVQAGGTTFNESMSGAITPSATTLKQVNKPLLASIAPVSILIKQTNRALSGALQPASQVLKSIDTRYSGSLAGSGDITQEPQSRFAGSLTPVGTIGRLTVKMLAASITSSGTLLKSISRMIAGSITPAGTLANIKSFILSLAGSLSPAGLILKSMGKQTSGSTSLSGSATESTARSLGGSITPTGTLATIRAVLINLVGAVVPIGQLTRLTTKGVSGSIALSGTIAKTISRVFSGVIGWAGSVANSILGITVKLDVRGRDSAVTTIMETNARVTFLRVSDREITRTTMGDSAT